MHRSEKLIKVVGVGNIYACESLFAAEIHPEREARTLTQTEWSTLATVIREILKRAIHKGGTTLRDYVNSDAEPGYFQIELSVYGRQGQACHTCQAPIINIKQSQRSTWFCPRCQR